MMQPLEGITLDHGDTLMARTSYLSIAYEIEGEGIPLVFIHQVATDHRLWYYQQAYFHTRYRTITIDILGHGSVMWPPGDRPLEQTARHVQQLLQQLGIGPAFVIGLCAGAAVAMLVALEAPTLLRGLVLVNPWSTPNAHLRSLGERLFRLAESKDMVAYMDLFQRYAFPAGAMGYYRTEIERLQTLVLEQDPRAVAYAWAACLAVNLGERLTEISTPSLIMAGSYDLFTLPYQARTVAERLREAELEVWEETGHFPCLEDPERFNARLEVFIRRCLARREIAAGPEGAG
jgi:3-oxoadipate enol-lactonase